MNTEMFCFQCEQTAGCSGCTGKAGVCGKKAETAGLQDRLTGALISLAKDEERAGREKLPEAVAELMMRGLFATVTNVNSEVADFVRTQGYGGLCVARGCPGISG